MPTTAVLSARRRLAAESRRLALTQWELMCCSVAHSRFLLVTAQAPSCFYLVALLSLGSWSSLVLLRSMGDRTRGDFVRNAYDGLFTLNQSHGSHNHSPYTLGNSPELCASEREAGLRSIWSGIRRNSCCHGYSSSQVTRKTCLCFALGLSGYCGMLSSTALFSQLGCNLIEAGVRLLNLSCYMSSQNFSGLESPTWCTSGFQVNT